MSRYRIVLIFLSFLSFCHAKVTAQPLIDARIVQGLFYEQHHAFEPARRVFADLYDQTKQKVFLLREAHNALRSESHLEETLRRMEKAGIKDPTLEELRLLIPLYGSTSQLKKAKKFAHLLFERSDKPMDIDIASYSFILTGDYKDAERALLKLYEKTHSEESLLRLVSLKEYLKKSDEALTLLETHRRIYPASKRLYATLLALYVKRKDVEGIISTYQALYKADPNPKYLQKLIEAYAYRRDLEGALKYLESVDAPKEILYDLYKATKNFDKAFSVAQTMYRKTKKPLWLAEQAVLTYESAQKKNDRKMLQKVVSLFDRALKEGVDDSIYLNYFGYTLIDHDIDIDKGIAIVKEALKQQADNSYYLDSLAWGYYKLRRCKEAFEIMKRVVEIEGLKEQEIIDHWKAIKQCK